jgi:CobQ-like glutamine amidotransferase family enzyme
VRDTAVRIVSLAPDLLGTYGDAGNVTILAERLRWRDVPVEIIDGVGTNVPDSGDIYVIGGGEDGPQTLAARELAASHALPRAVDRGAVVFAVCAGFQILGQSFPGAGGEATAGVGIIDVTSVRDGAARRVGEIAVEADVLVPHRVLSGFENHGAATRLGPDATPLGRVRAGRGNDDGTGAEGAVCGRVVGTYLHGPALARNPDLADALLTFVVGPLAPLDDCDANHLRDERLDAVLHGARHRGRLLTRIRGRR